MKGILHDSQKQEEYDLVLDGASGVASTQKKRPSKSLPTASSWYYLGFIGEVGFTIALPIVGGALVGTYADRMWSTYPKATLSFIFIGIVISVVGFVRTIQEIIRKSSK